MRTEIDRLKASVVFITTPRAGFGEGDENVQEPIGTGFIVRTDYAGADQGEAFRCVVTAGHVVNEHAPTFIRTRQQNIPSKDLPFKRRVEVVDTPAGNWVHHHEDSVDLAASWLPPAEEGMEYFGGVYVKLPIGWTKGGTPQVGDRVEYIGLLDPVSEMGERLVPFVRSGRLGATDQEKIPLETEKGLVSADGHLLDCHGQGGFSGAPVFARLTGATEQPTLLGAFVGYFQDKRGLGPINTGIGVVVPVERITELLMQDEFAPADAVDQ